MVRILSNGDIVPDDDPRAQRSGSRKTRGDNANKPRQGFVQHTDYGQNQGQGRYMGEVQQVSVFDVVNQKLLTMGIPRFSIGRFTFEPIVSIGFLLAGVFFGLPGLVFAGLLFLVTKISQPGGNPFTGRGRQQGGAAGNHRPEGGGGGGSAGYRLGRS